LLAFKQEHNKKSLFKKMAQKTKNNFLFYFVVIVISGVIFKTVEYQTGFPYNYFESSSVTGFILHVSMYTMFF